MAAKVFISYRRDDTRADARHLQDRLQRKLGRRVFMDVNNLRPGQRFDQELDAALRDCNIFLAVIGPRWMELLSERLRAAEHDPDHRDFVRVEIAEALRRGIVVIPILVDGADLPPANALPGDIRDLALHQKHDVTHERFGRDVDDLVAVIREIAREHSRNQHRQQRGLKPGVVPDDKPRVPAARAFQLSCMG